MNPASPDTPSAAYGAWPSIIDAAAVAAGARAIGEPRVLDGVVYWLESRPAEGGRNTLLCRRPGEPAVELTPVPLDVRSRVHEYGGGAYLPTPMGVVLVDFASRDLLLLDESGMRTLLAGEPGVRFADFAFDARHRRLIMVSERHRDGAEPVNALETLSLASPGATAERLHLGHDFYAAPRIAADGRLAFLSWDHPNMPWDGTELRLLEFDASGRPASATLISGGAAESVLAPTWLDDALIFASDQNGCWNLCPFDPSGVHCLLEEACEYAAPPWLLGQSTFAAAGTAHVVALRRDGQHQELVIVDAARGLTTPLPADWLTFSGVCCDGNAVVFVGTCDAGPAELVRLPLDGGAGDALRERSPIHHVDRLSCPVIFLQGDEDRVVAPAQARVMVAALDARGLPVAYQEFAGEGHGFRRAENVQRALESEYAFYCHVFGIEPVEQLPPLEIRNL